MLQSQFLEEETKKSAAIQKIASFPFFNHLDAIANQTTFLGRFVSKIKTLDSIQKASFRGVSITAIPNFRHNSLEYEPPKLLIFGPRSSCIPGRRRNFQIFNPGSLIEECDEHPSSTISNCNDRAEHNSMERTLTRRVLRVANPDILFEKTTKTREMHPNDASQIFEHILTSKRSIIKDGQRSPNELQFSGNAISLISESVKFDRQISPIESSERNINIKIIASVDIADKERVKRNLTIVSSISAVGTLQTHSERQSNTAGWDARDGLLFNSKQMRKAFPLAVKSNNECQITEFTTSFCLRGAQALSEASKSKRDQCVSSSSSFDHEHNPNIFENVDFNVTPVETDFEYEDLDSVFDCVNAQPKSQDLQNVFSSKLEPSVAIFVEGKGIVADHRDAIFPILDKVSSQLEIILRRGGSKFPLIKDRKLQLITAGLTPKNISQRDPESLKVLLYTPRVQIEVATDLQSPMPRGSTTEKNNFLIWN